MSENLRECPFCGGEAEFRIFDNICNVVCTECHIGTRYELLDSVEQVVAAWNTRAERTCRNDNGWCDECEHFLHDGFSYCPWCGAKITEVDDD